MFGREVLLLHSEAVPTLRVHVQFGRFVSAGSLFLQSDAVRGESEIDARGDMQTHPHLTNKQIDK